MAEFDEIKVPAGDGQASMDPPPWIVAYAQDCRRLLGIGDEWRIVIQMVPAGDGTIDGICTADARYFNARIELSDNLPRNGDGHEVILHEMLHVALAPLAGLYDRLVGDMGWEARRVALGAYQDVEEQVIQRMTRALLRQVTPPAADEE